MPANSKPAAVLPVTIVAGYLGSGKTTLINHVINSTHVANGSPVISRQKARRYAVLVNDFGELAIDAQLIESEDGNVISLSGGCVCCSYGNDLTRALMQLDTSAIDQVVIEASGVALPGAIAESLSLLAGYTVSAIVVLADSTTIEHQSKDRYIADTIARQLAAADLLLLNKTDLLDELQIERVKEWLCSNYSAARVVVTSQTGCPVDLFLVDHSENHINHSALANSGVVINSDAHTTSIYATFTLDVNGQYDVPALASKLASVEPGLLRVKGFVVDLDGQMQLVQIVGKRWAVQPASVGAKQGLVCIGLSSDKVSYESVCSMLGLTQAVT